jgi:hypothetical protein
MMLHDMPNDDALSLSMFWAGALMVFTPMICAAVVLGVWWRQRGRDHKRDRAREPGA